MNLWQQLWTCLLAGSLAVALAAPAGAAGRPEVHADVERARFYQGETVRYRVLLDNFEQDVTPIVRPVDAITLRLTGSQRVDSQEITIVNGRAETRIRRRQMYDYALTAEQPGTLTIPGPTVEADGKKYEGNAVDITVLAVADQDVAILELTSSRSEVYPMQPFEVTLTVAIKPIPEPHSHQDPTGVQDPPLQLSLPWANDDVYRDAVQPKAPRERWLENLLSDMGGFSINGEPASRSSLNDVFNRFFSDQRTGRRVRAFRPSPERELRADKEGRRVEYWVYRFTRTFIPRQIGEYAFGPVSLKGVFGTRTDVRGRLEGESIYTYAPPILVRVKDVPSQGRPPTYTGAVGRFQLTADVAPREAKVGDPLTLTLSLTGNGTLEQATAPKLESLPGLSADFKVYEATEETRDQTRLFTYSLRPRHAQVAEVPPLPLSYFDVEREQFVTLQTPAIPLRISPADSLSAAEIALAQPAPQSGNSVEARLEGIFANVTNPRQLRNEAVDPQRWFAGLGALAGVFCVIALVTEQLRRRHGDPSLRRRRGALSAARARLRAAQAELATSNSRFVAEQLSAALLGFVCDVTDAPPGSQTSQDAAERLTQTGVGDANAARFRSLMQACDDARYGSQTGAGDSLGRQAESLLDELARELKAKRLLP